MEIKHTAEDLDRAYSPSSLVENYRDVVTDYTTRSKITLAQADSKRISYGMNPQEYVILFEPTHTVSSALLVFFHGGYWQDLSADDSCFPADTLLNAGMSYASVNYTLAPNASIPTIIEQCALALTALAEFRPDAHIVIAGSSAGAHLAAMLMSLNWGARGLHSTPFSGAVLISGIYDLRPLIRTYINVPLGLDIASAAAASPSLLPVRVITPTIVCWGEYETSEFKRQSNEYAIQLAKTGVPVSSYEVSGKNHFDILFDLSNSSTRLGCDTIRLLEQRL